MKKWNLIIDLARCHDCNNCFLSCKDEHVGNDFPPFSVGQPWHGQRWMNVLRQGRTVGEALAGTFGDFFIDDVEIGKTYTLAVEAPGYRPQVMIADLDVSRDLGTIVLETDTETTTPGRRP